MKFAIVGYGKMGKAIEAIAVERGHTINLIIDRNNPADLTTENLRQSDVVIEFTGPESAAANVEQCLKTGVPVVCGSTGWLEKLDAMKKLATEKNTALLVASNFSVGVNIFFALNQKLAQLMAGQDDYKVAITEIHHTAKKDAPSGTAITLAEGIIKNGGPSAWHLEQVEAHGSSIPITAIRQDPAPGTHMVKYSSEIDDIEITHTAHSRHGFAVGAVLAAEFLAGKKGVYTMQDVLGI